VAKDRPPTLRRSLGLFETTMGGVGIILGAGIYALVGVVAGKAGNAMWVSFLIAGAMAATIGLCYAEMASAFPRAAADYDYTRRAFGPRAAFVIGWLIVIGNLVAGATVALGFGAYVHVFVDVSPTLAAAAALVVATLVAFYGIKESVWVSILMTFVEVGGLVLVIAIGVPHLGDFDLLDVDHGLTGLFSGAALVMFAFIGFTEIATLAEEAEDASRVVPRAMLLALGVTTALYLLVAVAATSVLGAGALSESSAPLAAVAADAVGDRASDLVALIALFSTGNTVLLLMITASRLIYGMAAERALPRFLAWVHPQARTPARAIAVCLVVALGFALSGDIGLVAGAANFAIFIAFGAVCLSLIVLRYSQSQTPRPFRVPLNVGRMPLIALLAVASVIFLVANLDRDSLLVGGGLLLAGLVAMEVLSLWRPQPSQGR
jgi:APA family basic amino acid/polyamine antiporter